MERRSVTIRDLRNHGGEVVDRVAGGEALTVTRDGRAVAELRPLAPRGTPTRALLEQWRNAASLDWATMRDELDAIVDPRLG